jgi:hypothetical protein
MATAIVRVALFFAHVTLLDAWEYSWSSELFEAVANRALRAYALAFGIFAIALFSASAAAFSLAAAAEIAGWYIACGCVAGFAIAVAGTLLIDLSSEAADLALAVERAKAGHYGPRRPRALPQAAKEAKRGNVLAFARTIRKSSSRAPTI